MAGRRRRLKNGAATSTGLTRAADTPVRLLQDIEARRVDAGTLTKAQRQACLVVLADGKQTSAELAAIFKVGPRLIRRDLQEIRARLGREVREWGLEEVLGQTVMVAEKCRVHAMRQEDPGLAWSIQRDLVRVLKELGALDHQERDGLRITVEAIGAGYERARQVLGRALDPRFTGEEPPRADHPLMLPAPPREVPREAAIDVDAVVE